MFKSQAYSDKLGKGGGIILQISFYAMFRRVSKFLCVKAPSLLYFKIQVIGVSVPACPQDVWLYLWWQGDKRRIMIQCQLSSACERFLAAHVMVAKHEVKIEVDHYIKSLYH